ncbi:MAG: fasciclin domain-containing protein [Gemmatimonadaceae bacterium]|jgi:transforming growth factor-beta-induced protein|nr:fasciclin domain-containing protein [Gemmatimonadaceae bacterium]
MHSSLRSPRVMRRFAPVMMIAATLFAACGDDEGTTEPERPATIVAAAQATPNLSTLVTALTAANLTGTLSGTGPFTVFAPVNSAFDAVPADVLQRLLATGNVEILSKVLRYHVVPGRVRAADLREGQEVTTVEGTTLRITLAGGARVNNARITTTDIETGNGVVHLIDGVLTESLDIVDVAIIRGFSSLVSAVSTAGLVNAVRGNGAGQGITVFAPTNAAFTALGTLPANPALTQVLTYHVVNGRLLAAQLTDNQQLTTLQGGTVRFRTGPARLQGIGNTVNITTTDIVAKNGVIHVIDAVLLPTAPVTQNIVQLASATPQLSTLVTAIGAANLGATLSGTGPFTVFAPVNSAFQAVPADVLARLLETGNVAILSKVLRYHVVPGRILAADLTEGQTVTTVEGTTLRITLAGGARVNNARITTTDIAATNGVVHLIDGVLTESLDVVDVATIRGFSSLVNAAATAGIVDALRGNGAGQGITVFAPTNAAFTALGPLPSNPTLTSVLTAHVINGRVLAAAVTNNLVAPSLQGGNLTLLTGPLRIRGLGNATPLNITATDIVAKNGVIHVIDGIILP